MPYIPTSSYFGYDDYDPSHYAGALSTSLGPTPPIPNPALGPVGFGRGPSWRPPTAKEKAKVKTKVKAGGGGTGATGMSFMEMAQRYAKLFGTQQQSVLDSMLEKSRRRGLQQQAAMGGFGEALMGYSKGLWDQTAAGYQNAAQAQQSLAAGVGEQVGAGARAGEASVGALASALGSASGGVTSPAAAQAQVASEGGANTGAAMGAVGTAWGGYGATRPETIGFMTGEQQRQLAREQIEADEDLKEKFLELGMGNLEKGITIASTLQEQKAKQGESAYERAKDAREFAYSRLKDRRQYGIDLKTQALTAQTLGVKDKQFWAELNERIRQNDLADKVDWANVGIGQTNAASSRISANASATQAAAAKAAAEADKASGGKAGTAYNTLYTDLYGLASGGDNSPLYNKKTLGSALDPQNPIRTEYVKKPRAQARAALLARAQAFLGQYGGYRGQVLAAVEQLLDMAGFPKQGKQPKQTGGGVIGGFRDEVLGDFLSSGFPTFTP